MFPVPKAEETARTFTGVEGLGCRLIEAAEAELGPSAGWEEIDERASRLALRAALKVGLEEGRSLEQRSRLAAVLSGTAPDPADAAKALFAPSGRWSTSPRERSRRRSP